MKRILINSASDIDIKLQHEYEREILRMVIGGKAEAKAEIMQHVTADMFLNVTYKKLFQIIEHLKNKGYLTYSEELNNSSSIKATNKIQFKASKFIFTTTPSYPGLDPNSVYIDYTVVISVPDPDTLIKANDYTTPSGAIMRMRWGWSVDPLSNRWDMLQNGYRPQKDFLHDDYVESRMHIRGRGKAFQIEIRNDDNRDFRLTGLNIITRSPQ